MKKFFKNALVFICVFMLSATTVLADKNKESKAKANEKPLYEKYGYDEEFEYDDVTIGHALKSTVAKIVVTYEADLLYSPVVFNREKFQNYKQRLMQEYADSSTSREIESMAVDYLNRNLAEFLALGEEENLKAIGQAVGSGVTISEDGYVATNAHVATVSEEDKEAIRNNAFYENNIVEGNFSEIEAALKSVGLQKYENANGLYNLIEKNVVGQSEVKGDRILITVCFPTENGSTNFEDGKKYNAIVVAEGTAINRGFEGQTEDVAILKMEAENIVCLALSDSYPETNSKIVSAGFPAVADQGFQMAGSLESVLSVTIGTGQIARLVPLKGTNLRAIEITTNISGGNSGGPSVDEGIRIEGLNTYSVSEDKRYAYMVPAEYVRQLSKKFDIGQGEVSLTFLTGLQMLQQKNGEAALECFEYVSGKQKKTPYIKHLISLAEKQIEKSGKAKNAGKKDSNDKKDNGLMLVIIISSVSALIVITVVCVAVSKSRKKKNTIGRGDAIPMPGGYVPGVAPVHPEVFNEGRISPVKVIPEYQQSTDYYGENNFEQTSPEEVIQPGVMADVYQSEKNAQGNFPERAKAPTGGLKSTMRTKAESVKEPEEKSISEHSAFKMASKDLDE